MKEPADDNELNESLENSGLSEEPRRPTSRVQSVVEDMNATLETDDTEQAAAPGQAPVFPTFEKAAEAAHARNDIGLLEGVNVKVQVLLGRSRLSVEQILALGNGSVVELDKLAGEPLDILVNDKLVAQGEVLVLNDNFCIRVTDIIPPEERT